MSYSNAYPARNQNIQKGFRSDNIGSTRYNGINTITGDRPNGEAYFNSHNKVLLPRDHAYLNLIQNMKSDTEYRKLKIVLIIIMIALFQLFEISDDTIKQMMMMRTNEDILGLICENIKCIRKNQVRNGIFSNWLQSIEMLQRIKIDFFLFLYIPTVFINYNSRDVIVQFNEEKPNKILGDFVHKNRIDSNTLCQEKISTRGAGDTINDFHINGTTEKNTHSEMRIEELVRAVLEFISRSYIREDENDSRYYEEKLVNIAEMICNLSINVKPIDVKDAFINIMTKCEIWHDNPHAEYNRYFLQDLVYVIKNGTKPRQNNPKVTKKTMNMQGKNVYDHWKRNPFNYNWRSGN